MSQENGQGTRDIPISQIRENPVALRTAQTNTEKFKNLCDSIRQHGVFNSITVRELRDPNTGETYYGLVDGLQRFTASKLVGKETIPATIKNLTEGQALEAQIVANTHKLETKPAEYAAALKRLLVFSPMMTLGELASRLNKSSAWLEGRLRLVNLTPAIQKLVNDNDIVLSNAEALAKLPPEYQQQFTEQAMTQSPSEFIGHMAKVAKEIKQAKSEGRQARVNEFQINTVFRKKSEIEGALEDNRIMSDLISANNVNDPLQAARLALQWVMKIDPQTAAARKQKHEEDMAQRKANAEARKAERKAQAEAEARKKVGQLETANV